MISHTTFIFLAYGMTAFVIFTLICWVLFAGSRRREMIARLERNLDKRQRVDAGNEGRERGT